MTALRHGAIITALLILGPAEATAASASAPRPVAAPAQVLVLNRHGQVLHSVRARATVTLVITARLPHGFPTGYTDIRFVVSVNGHPKRTVIYGKPKHVHAGDVVTVRLLTGISPTWVGKVEVRGTLHILTKPDGTATRYFAQGTARLTVTK